jgi:PAS domain S-box-containing protein
MAKPKSWRIDKKHGQERVMKQRECSPSVSTVLTLLCFVLIIILSAGAQLKQTRRVLIINDLGIVSSPGFAEIDQAIFSGLQNSPYQIELYQESLQLTFFPDEASRRSFRGSLIRKYSERKPDLIIAAGSESLKFIAESHERFIRETPIIFCTVLGDIPDQLKSGLHVTGVLGRLQPEETFKAALHLLPGTKHVVVVGGMGKFDEGWERVAKRAFRDYESKFDFTYLTELTMSVLLERLRHLPSNTIVYHTAITQDAAGARFIDSAQSVPLVASAANAPVFVMDDVDLRAGTVGGALVNWADDARVAANMAVQVLDGKRPEDIPIVMSNNAYVFDWRALTRWGLKESNLPPGSIVLNRQPTFWEAYKEYVIATILVLLAQTVAIFALLRQRAKTRKTQAELRKSEEKFSKAFQRSPLAFTLASLVNYRFVEVNDTFERYTGWNREEIVGRTPLEIQFWVNTNQRSTFIEQLRAQGSVRSMEILFRRKDGQMRTGLVSSELIDLNGEPCALSLIADVTEAKQAEKARHDSEERLRLAQHAARIGTFEWNIRTGVNTWTQELEAMYGLPRGGFGGTQTAFENLVHPDDLAGVIDLVDVSLKTGQPTEGEWRIVWPDGSVHWIAARWQVFMDEAGEPLRMVGINIDVTQRKLAEESLANIGRRLIEAHEEERTWIARELHDDINQRMALLAIELDRWNQQLPDSAVEFHDHIHHASQRLSEIAKDIQALSHRLHSSKLEYLGLVVAAKSFCKELSEQQKVEIDFSHTDIPQSVPKEISLCLFRVLQETLQNAVKHSGVRHFKVGLCGTEGEIQLTVSDLGVGFDPQEAINRRGLGLVSMRERLQLVNGEFSVKSQPGGGTTIHARVPFTGPDSRLAAG